MKVAMSFPECHRKAGVERIMFEAARFLSSRGHSVSIYANEWEVDESCSIDYQPVTAWKQPPFLHGISYYHYSQKQLQRAEYDVLNTYGCVCPLDGVHWVQSVHRAWLTRSKMFRHPLSKSRLKQRLNPAHPILLALEEKHFRDRRYQKIIATTPEVRDDLNHFYGVPPEDVVIMPNGFSPTEFNPQHRAERRAQMRARLGLAEEHIALLFVANELQRKGYRTILEALRLLNRPELRLLVVGRPARQSVERQAAEFGLTNQVIACGPTQDVSAYHAASDAFVLPTQYEAYCLAILEALGSGLPVVTTRVPGAQDAIQHGCNGFLIDDPKSGAQCAAVLEPLLDLRVREQMSSEAAQSSLPFRWPSILPQYEDLLLECAGERSAPGIPQRSEGVAA